MPILGHGAHKHSLDRARKPLITLDRALLVAYAHHTRATTTQDFYEQPCPETVLAGMKLLETRTSTTHK